MAETGFDLENHFLSKIMIDSDYSAVAKFHITDEHFFDASNGRVFAWIREHVQKYGEMPTAAMLKRNWPNYRLVRVEHGIEYYGQELRSALMHQRLLETIDDLQTAAEERDVQGGYEMLAQHLQDLAPIATITVDEDLTQNWEERIASYRAARGKGKMRGLSTGFASIDRATLGMAAGQFWVLVGLPKAGKSTILLAFAIAVHDANRRPLFIGFEMTNIEQSARYDAMVAQVDHLKLMSGRMSRDDERKLIDVLEEREDLAPFILSADVESATTVSGISAKIDEYNPNAVFIDGLYMMQDEMGEPVGSSAALTNITRGLARLSKIKEVPIIGTTQVLHSKVTKSTGITMGSVGYSSSFAQDCHVMIAVEASEFEDTLQTLKGLANRSGPKFEADVYWDWSNGTFEEMDADDDEE